MRGVSSSMPGLLWCGAELQTCMSLFGEPRNIATKTCVKINIICVLLLLLLVLFVGGAELQTCMSLFGEPQDIAAKMCVKTHNICVLLLLLLLLWLFVCL